MAEVERPPIAHPLTLKAAASPQRLLFVLLPGLRASAHGPKTAQQRRVGYNAPMSDETAHAEITHLEGFISVQAALQGGHRVVQSIQLRAGKEDGQTRHLTRTARRLGIPLTRVSADEIERLAGGKTHGGVLAQVGPYQFAPLDSLTVGTAPFVVMIDGVEDPFNFGSLRPCTLRGGGGRPGGAPPQTGYRRRALSRGPRRERLSFSRRPSPKRRPKPPTFSEGPD